MKTVTKTYQVYSFDELEEDSKNKAISNEVRFWIEIGNDENTTFPPDIQRAFKKAESMQTPWFTGEYIMEYAKDFILSECKCFDYLADGTIFSE
jgi:hypothetical protein